MNPSTAEDVHFIQMWVLPDTERIDPGYEQHDINAELDKGGIQPIASGQGHDAAISIRQRGAVLWGGRLKPGEIVSVPDGRHAHLFVAAGRRRPRRRRRTCRGRRRPSRRRRLTHAHRRSHGRRSADLGHRLTVLILSQADVAAVLDMAALIDVIERAMDDVSAGRASMPPRVGAMVAERGGILAAMPAFLPSSGAHHQACERVSREPRPADAPGDHLLLRPRHGHTDRRHRRHADHRDAHRRRVSGGHAPGWRAGRTSVAIIGTGVQERDARRGDPVLGYDDIVVCGRSTAVSSRTPYATPTSSAPPRMPTRPSCGGSGCVPERT